jgi:hypothetical protein
MTPLCGACPNLARFSPGYFISSPSFPSLNSPVMATTSRSLDQVLADLLAEMRNRLPEALANLPEPNVSITSVSERALAIGNWRGNERRGAIADLALKGGRLDAVVRFQLWADEPILVDTAINELHGRLLAARDSLRAAGFLRLKAENTRSAESILVSGVNAWRKTTDYRVLYEFHFEDTDEAQSLIARIPVSIDSAFGESMVVTDDMAMARWDDQAAPALVMRGRATLTALSAFAFTPDPVPTGTVTLTRTFDGAPGAPTDLALAPFLAAAARSNAPERHARVTFPSLNGFLDVFTAAGDLVAMGDLDGDGLPDEYSPLILAFSPAIELQNSAERFEIAFQNAAFEKLAVVYLRTNR